MTVRGSVTGNSMPTSPLLHLCLDAADKRARWPTAIIMGVVGFAPSRDGLPSSARATDSILVPPQ